MIGGGAWAPKAERALSRFGPRIGAAARVLPMMLAGLAAWHATHTQIVIVGRRDDAETQAMLGQVARRYRPFATVIPVDPEATQPRLSALLPWIASMHPIRGRAAGYVCRDFACQQPAPDAASLAEQL
jgi:uncharacterized protein YyaL (SSP411 family)